MINWIFKNDINIFHKFFNQVVYGGFSIAGCFFLNDKNTFMKVLKEVLFLLKKFQNSINHFFFS